ncbi:MAG: CdaR family protein [Hydrogenothermaceae bacterium]
MKLRFKKVKRALKSLIFEDFLLKSLSIATAIILWLYVTSAVKTKYQFYSYVEVINIPPDIEIVKIKPEKVKIIVEGRRSLINNDEIGKLTAYVNGKNLKVGKNELKVNIFAEGLSREDVVTVEPENVIIYARKLQKKEVY